MNQSKKKLAIVSIVIVVVCLFLDQLIKCWVVGNMSLYQTIPLCGDWLNLHYILNEGMAFGLSWGANVGKLTLSLLRIAVVAFLIYYLVKNIKKQKIDMLVTCVISLIVAGALGNIVDSAIYGILFQGKPFMFGSVVDMFYVKLFPIPDWFPVFGGNYFFPAIFNFADSCVTVGILLMICCYRHFFPKEETRTAETSSEAAAE